MSSRRNSFSQPVNVVVIVIVWPNGIPSPNSWINNCHSNICINPRRSAFAEPNDICFVTGILVIVLGRCDSIANGCNDDTFVIIFIVVCSRSVVHLVKQIVISKPHIVSLPIIFLESNIISKPHEEVVIGIIIRSKIQRSSQAKC